MKREEFKELLWIARGGLDTCSLENLNEQTGYDPEDVEDDLLWAEFKVSVLQDLVQYSYEEWGQEIGRRRLDSNHLELLVKAIEEVAVDVIRRTRPQDVSWKLVWHKDARTQEEEWTWEPYSPPPGRKVGAIYRCTRLMYSASVAAEEGHKPVVVSDYLHIMNLRASTRPKIPTRALARMLYQNEHKESLIRRMDRDARKLNVSRHDWDIERLLQIMKPLRKRGPP